MRLDRKATKRTWCVGGEEWLVEEMVPDVSNSSINQAASQG